MSLMAVSCMKFGNHLLLLILRSWFLVLSWLITDWSINYVASYGIYQIQLLGIQDSYVWVILIHFLRLIKEFFCFYHYLPLTGITMKVELASPLLLCSACLSVLLSSCGHPIFFFYPLQVPKGHKFRRF
jgi:hypothetical protein